MLYSLGEVYLAKTKRTPFKLLLGHALNLLSKIKSKGDFQMVDQVEGTEVAGTETPAAAPKSIAHVKELLLLLVDVVKAAQDVAKDGKVDLTDLAAIIRVIPNFGPALAGIGEVPGEIADIDSAEITELLSAVTGKLSFEDAKTQLVVEKALKAVAALGDLSLAVLK